MVATSTISNRHSPKRPRVVGKEGMMVATSTISNGMESMEWNEWNGMNVEWNEYGMEWHEWNE